MEIVYKRDEEEKNKNGKNFEDRFHTYVMRFSFEKNKLFRIVCMKIFKNRNKRDFSKTRIRILLRINV